MWQGPERRSEASRAARAAMAAKTEREVLEEELEQVPGWRFRRRTELEQARDDALERERRLLQVLGGRR
jgi:hypothetical protein